MNSMIRSEITGTATVIRGNDIDTDQIIPARFLKEITFDNMDKYLFNDQRFSSDNQPLEHVLNTDLAKSSAFLIVNKNFGCGSSREHAPQSIMRFGFKAIIGESFSEIFSGNCKAIGIPVVTAPHDVIDSLMTTIEMNLQSRLTLDIANKALWVADTKIDIFLPEDRHHAFLTGTWDALGTLKNNIDLIQAKDQDLPYSF